MSHRYLLHSALLAALLGSATLALGQSSQTPVRISLDQAIQFALAHNHSLQAARSTIVQSQDQEVTANLRPNPVFTADGLFIPLFSPNQLTADNLDTLSEFDAGLSYLFERGKKRQHRLRAAQDQTAVTKSTVADNQRSLTFSVASQFTNALLAESALDFARQDLQGFQNTVEISEAQYKAGAISEGDLLKIKLQLLQFQTDVTSAQLAREQALAALRQLLGFESVPIDYDVEGELQYQKLPYNLEDLQAMAIKNRPDLRAAQQNVYASQSEHALAKADGKVDVTGSLTYTHVSGFNSLSTSSASAGTRRSRLRISSPASASHGRSGATWRSSLSCPRTSCGSSRRLTRRSSSRLLHRPRNRAIRIGSPTQRTPRPRFPATANRVQFASKTTQTVRKVRHE